jgi:hypothetical protein
MIERRNRSSFLQESPPALGISKLVTRQNFDGNSPVQASVEGTVDLSHPSGAQRSFDAVWSQVPPSGKAALGYLSLIIFTAQALGVHEIYLCVSADYNKAR